MCKLCAYMVDAGMFRSVVLSTLQVGHTHEDIDFLFSIMSSHISRMLEWDSPQQMAEIVQRRMSQHMSQRIVQEHVRAGTLDAVRDWTTWLSNYADVAEREGLMASSKCIGFVFSGVKICLLSLQARLQDQPLAVRQQTQMTSC